MVAPCNSRCVFLKPWSLITDATVTCKQYHTLKQEVIPFMQLCPGHLCLTSELALDFLSLSALLPFAFSLTLLCFWSGGGSKRETRLELHYVHFKKDDNEGTQEVCHDDSWYTNSMFNEYGFNCNQSLKEEGQVNWLYSLGVEPLWISGNDVWLTSVLSVFWYVKTS